MTKGVTLRTWMFIIIPSVLCLNPVFVASVEDCHNCGGPGTPTSAGNARYTGGWNCECTGARPTIVATYQSGMDTIDSNNPVILSVTGGCPPYTWSTSSKGYSLTHNEDGTVTLSLINTSGKICGTGGSGDYDIYATVTVTDNCGKPDDIVMRYSGGKWTVIVGGGGYDVKGTKYSEDYINGWKKLTLEAWKASAITHDVGPGPCSPVRKLGSTFLCGGTGCGGNYTNAQLDAMWDSTLVDAGFSPSRMCQWYSCMDFINMAACPEYPGTGWALGYQYYYYEWTCP